MIIAGVESSPGCTTRNSSTFSESYTARVNNPAGINNPPDLSYILPKIHSELSTFHQEQTTTNIKICPFHSTSLLLVWALWNRYNRKTHKLRLYRQQLAIGRINQISFILEHNHRRLLKFFPPSSTTSSAIASSRSQFCFVSGYQLAYYRQLKARKAKEYYELCPLSTTTDAENLRTSSKICQIVSSCRYRSIPQISAQPPLLPVTFSSASICSVPIKVA